MKEQNFSVLCHLIFSWQDLGDNNVILSPSHMCITKPNKGKEKASVATGKQIYPDQEERQRIV